MTRAAQLAGLGSLEGSAPAYACRAWVNFNGTGTVAIRASGNVSSITDNGVGQYSVSFSTAMPDANYVCNVTPMSGGYMGGSGNSGGGEYSTTSVKVGCVVDSGTWADSIFMSVSVFR